MISAETAELCPIWRAVNEVVGILHGVCIGGEGVRSAAEALAQGPLAVWGREACLQQRRKKKVAALAFMLPCLFGKTQADSVFCPSS